MSDNLTTQNASLSTIPSGSVIATDDISGVAYQRVKITQGIDGAATDVSTANPLPVTGGSAQNTTTFGQTGALILGAVSSSASTFSAGTSNALSLNTSGGLRVDGSGVTQPVSGSVSITSSTATIGSVLFSTAGALSVSVSSSTGTIGAVSVNGSVTLSSGLLALGTVGVTSITSSTTPIGSVAQAGLWSVSLTSGVLPLGSVTLTSGTLALGTVTLSSGTAVLGSLVANQSVNVAQINGVTALMGNGGTGTGSQRVTIASDNTAFNVSGSNETSTIYSGTTAITPSFAIIDTSSTGVTAICTAVTSKSIRVVSANLIAAGATTISWLSASSSSTKSGRQAISANGGLVLPYNPVGWFQTVSGEGLSINNSAAAQVGGSLTFIAV